jgi:hypothetical protein
LPRPGRKLPMPVVMMRLVTVLAPRSARVAD